MRRTGRGQKQKLSFFLICRLRHSLLGDYGRACSYISWLLYISYNQRGLTDSKGYWCSEMSTVTNNYWISIQKSIIIQEFTGTTFDLF